MLPKLIPLICLVTTLFAISVNTIASETRTWTSTKGTTIKAKLISSTDTQVTLRRTSDGRTLKVSISQLSQVDKDWLKAQSEVVEKDSSESRDKDISELTHIPGDTNGIIRLPLRVHIITGIELEQKGVTMSTWVTPEDVRKTILPEINRIWESAKIEWVLESVTVKEAEAIPDRASAITYIQNSKRDANGKSDPERMPKILALCGLKKEERAVNNLYFFPYMGQTSQGTAAMRGNWAVCGVWTDKPSKAQKRPEKFRMVERGKFKVGSLARTCSHELGHNLGLEHPDKTTQSEFDRLMGGKQPGNELTDDEITLARKIAIERARKVLAWIEKNKGN